MTSNLALEKKLALVLLITRLNIALVFMVWAFDKILAPGHTVKVFAAFYNLDISTSLAVGLGVIQIAFISAFALGLYKSITYLAILVLHAGSTFAAFAKYLDPLNNLLFFAAWPMLAACIGLYLLREYDVWVLSKKSELAYNR